MQDRDAMRPVALTQGDPAGIGPDIALAAWMRRREYELPSFLYIGDPTILSDRARVLGLSVRIAESDADASIRHFSDAIPVLPLAAGARVAAGVPDPAAAKGTIGAIETAVSLCMSGAVSAVVTNPIAKSVLYQAGFGFPGHTEFLADLAAKATGQPILPVMMLAGPLLKTIPLTIHIALDDVPRAISRDLILQTARIAHRDLQRKFGFSAPRIAVAGLNPHAGEDGAMGREEIEIIRPAIEALQADGIDAIGPLPADTMFHPQARAGYDVALCMYHDQALIPAKALGFDDAVNVTLGLPFVRTSPDHGTAFALAGKGTAREHSLVAAVRLAARMGDTVSGRA